MQYFNFVQGVAKSVKTQLTDDMSVEVRTVEKNNGSKKVGLVISEKGGTLSPTIYMESFFEKLQQGATIDDIAEEVMKLYRDVKPNKEWDPQFIRDYEQARQFLVCRMINEEKNKELLKKAPHMKWMNLAIVAYLSFDVPGRGKGSVLVDNSVVELWGVSPEQIMKQATGNTEKIMPFYMSTLPDMVHESAGDIPFSMDEEEGAPPIFVLTTEDKAYGAIAVLYPGMMEDIATVLEQDYYIVPSSVHEVLIVPTNFGFSGDELEKMLQEVNRSEVTEDEILSDRVYFYSRETKKTEIR